MVDALSVGEIKTKAAAEMLRRLGVDGKALLVDVKPEDKLALSVRNIDGRAAAAEQPHQRPRRDGHPRVVLTRAALEKLQEALGLRTRHETHRRDPPAADHREDDGHPRGRPDAGVPGGEDANKIDIKRAVEQLLGSKVESVRTSLAHGKMKRQGRSSAGARTGRRRT